MWDLWIWGRLVLILSNISAGTGSVLIRCCPEGISFLLFGSLLEAVFCSVYNLSLYDIGHMQLLSYVEAGTMESGVDSEVHLQTNEDW